jgi:drug/metabolite transporter (DMT)-like permease
VIASYTLLDKRGITHASPLTYLELSMIPAALGYAAAVATVKGPAAIRSELNTAAVLAGCASFAAYALVLAALERASAASVAAVRETSVVMATGFAALVLHERVSGWRVAGSVLVVGGIALLALG